MFKQPLFILVLLSICTPLSASDGNQTNSKTIPAEAGARTQAVRELIGRILPGHENRFELELIPSENGEEFFQIGKNDDKVVLRGTTPSALCVAFNHYLRDTCRINVSWWSYDPVISPKVLPLPEKEVKHSARVDKRFFLNYCTYGYTTVWWGWEEWERLIDWMALQGVNMPLSIEGQEAVWLEVWKKFGLTDLQIRSFFTGPAHLPWHRMANIDAWHGPLPQSYIERQKKLQKRILARERELGMTPIQQVFSGHVPKALKQVQPKANIKDLASWSRHPVEYQTSMLDVMDPLFCEIQKAYLLELKKTYGTDHIYAADPFNEMTPPSWEPSYLARAGKTIYDCMAEADPKAVWLQMGWLFVYDDNWTPERIKAYMEAVPRGKMIMLDYYCESKEVWRKSDSFSGQSFIWSYLGNFGGHTYLGGSLKGVHDRIEAALKEARSLEGVGGTLEGLSPNPISYEYVLALAWDTKDTGNLEEWVRQYAYSRAGGKDENVAKAWDVIYKIGFSSNRILKSREPMINYRPSLEKVKSGTSPKKELVTALGYMLDADPQTKRQPGYQHDLVWIAHELAAEEMLTLWQDAQAAYEAKDAEKFKTQAAAMLRMAEYLDRLLGTRKEVLLGTAVADARDFGIDDKEKDYFEQNAKNIITTWSFSPNALNDYAKRSWSGLIRTYYMKRWSIFLDALAGELEGKPSLDDAMKRIESLEGQWWRTPSTGLASESKGDVVEIAKELYNQTK